MNDSERENWINNYEPLYQAWLQSRKGIKRFIRENRKEIDEIIHAEIHRYDGDIHERTTHHRR